MSAPQNDATIVAAMVREFDFARYASALFASPEKRRAMLALAAFDLEITRVADQVSQPLAGEMRLQYWSDAIEGLEHGGVSGHPVAAELLRAIETHALPRAPLLALIAAHSFDLYDDAMPTQAALDVYCDDTVGALIGLNATLLADTSVDDAVRKAGRAIGLARIVARLPHDAAHRRCFLPADAMAAHGVTRHQVLAGDETAQLRAMREDIVAKALAHASVANGDFRACPASLRPAFLPLAGLERQLDALQRLPTFALAPSPSRLRVLASQWRMMRVSFKPNPKKSRL